MHRIILNDNQEPEFLVRQATLEDDSALSDLVSVPMPTRGVMLSLQRKPSYFTSANVVCTVQSQSVVQQLSNNQIVAFFSNGYCPCFIDGEIKNLRYSSDLRVNTSYRGKSLVKILGQQMQATMQDPDFSHSIVFTDNQAARAATQTGKQCMPMWYDDCDIETLTLSGFKTKSQHISVLHQDESRVLEQIQRVQAESKHIAQMNAFVHQMAHFFNFMPAYDFSELQKNQDYYRDLKLEDFFLYFNGDNLVGMFGLWDQSKFKQSTITDYGLSIGIIRPIYNILMKLTGGIQLPKKGQHFRYYMLHSLLCNPNDLALHDYMLRDAFILSKARGVDYISYTLSTKDPRQQLNQYYKGQKLQAMHGFFSFKEDPTQHFDRNLISYLEVGRI